MSDLNMDVDANMEPPSQDTQPQQQTTLAPAASINANFSPGPAAFAPVQPVPVPGAPELPHAPTPPMTIPSTTTSARDFRDIPVKIHIRRPEKDSWTYLGRGIVSQEVTGHSSRIIVRTATGKVLVMFNETSDLQAEKRGNFVVVGCVEGTRVVSWSLNALNNSETLRLMASIELACYRCRQALSDPRQHSKGRRKIERIIKDDKRRRHKRRKDQEALVDAFSKQNLEGEPMTMDSGIATNGGTGPDGLTDDQL